MTFSKLVRQTLTAALAALTTMASAAANAATVPEPHTPYVLTNAFLKDTKALGVADGHVVMAAHNPGNPLATSEWMFSPVPGRPGYYRITNVSLGTAKSLDSSPTAPVIGNSGNYSGQLWKLVPAGNGYFRLTNMYQPRMSLQISGQPTYAPRLGRTANFSGQLWKLAPQTRIGLAPGTLGQMTSTLNVPKPGGTASRTNAAASDAVKALDPHQRYILTNAFLKDAKALGVANGRLVMAVNNPANSLATSEWMFSPVPGRPGYYRITNASLGTGKSLDSSPTEPVIGNSGNYSGQLWKLVPAGNGYYRLTNMYQPRKSLDNWGSAPYAPRLANTANYSGQLWKLTPASKAPSSTTRIPVTLNENLNVKPSGSLTLTESNLSLTSGTSGNALTPRAGNRIFPTGGLWEGKVLKALWDGEVNQKTGPGFRGSATQLATTFRNLSPLYQALGTLALDATEVYYAKNREIRAEQALQDLANDPKKVDAVVSLLGGLVATKVASNANDSATTALRAWAGEIYQKEQIKVGKAVLHEYDLWQRDPCSYELTNHSASKAGCNQYGVVFGDLPPTDILAKNAYGNVYGDVKNRAAFAGAAAGGAIYAAATAGVAGAVLGSALGGTELGAVTSLFSTFSTAPAAAEGVAVAGAGWAGMAAAPIAITIGGTVLSVARAAQVIEAGRFVPLVKAKLGQTMSQRTDAQWVGAHIRNELQDKDARNFFVMAFMDYAMHGWQIQDLNLDGEVRFFCQAGYVSRFTLSYTLNGARKTFKTNDLPVGQGQTFAVPAAATSISVGGEWLLAGWHQIPGSNQSITRPTYTGFISYGTIFGPKVKVGYPETAGITTEPNKLVFTQNGGYEAWLQITYTLRGVRQTLYDSKGWLILQKKTFDIPKGARDMRIYIREATGLVWEPWRTVYDKTMPSPQSTCVKVYGTTLDPHWNNECG